MFKNPFENIVYHEVLKSIVDKIWTFKINDDFNTYTVVRSELDLSDGIRMYVNAPKRYGVNTHTEMILVIRKKISFRIDCKFMFGSGNIQVNDIKGQIDKNIIENPLYEDKLIFVIGGNAISKEEKQRIMQYATLRNIQNQLEILTLPEFKKFMNKHKKL